MNRLTQFIFLIALLALGSVRYCSAQHPAPIPQQAGSGRGGNVAQNAASLRPPVETAVLEGVSPGVTTLEQLTHFWGDPKREYISGDDVARLYSMDPLNHIEVTVRGGIVRSIAIDFDIPLPEEDVRGTLQAELLRSKPVQIPNEQGVIIGQVFPERGVMFIFSPKSTWPNLLVERIAIEPVSAEPFVLRAEAILHDLPTEARQDLREAIRLKAEQAKIYWLLAQIDLWEGHVESAVLYIESAIQLDEQRPAYHLTFAQALIQMNRIEEAKQYLQEIVGLCDRFPHEKARVLLMLGELHRTGRHPNHEFALECHKEAIRLATALVNHSNPTVRLTAKDVLFESHLAAAKAIAWGNWTTKEGAIREWIGRAKILARDPELLETPRYSRDYQFKIAACALTTLVAIPENMNIDLYVDEVIEAGNELIKSANDPILRAKHFWDTSIALYDAVQIFQLRQQFSSALRYGEAAAEYMAIGLQGRNNDTDWYLLGRLYFRLGVIHAVGNENHRAAIEWYDRAKPIFERLLPKIDAGAWGPFGETFVSMGVSYWVTGQHAEAIRLTESGLRQLERGVRANVLDPSILEKPYANLAKMYHDLGDKEQAVKYMKLSAGERRIW